MEISVKFSAEELRLIWQALKLGSIHNKEDNKLEQMNQLAKKVEMIGILTKDEPKN